MSDALSPEVVAFLSTGSLFTEVFWMDAVAPGAWDVTVDRRGGEIWGALPFVWRRKVGGFVVIEMPPMTPFMGPVLRRGDGNRSRRMALEMSSMNQLIDQLPSFASFDYRSTPEVTNWLPFHWRGFSQTTRYTYRLPKVRPEDVWEGMEGRIRRNVRKARRTVEVVTADVQRLMSALGMTFARQGRALPFEDEVVERVAAACADRGRCEILAATDAAGMDHAVAMFVWDEEWMYYLLSGADPELRASGATALLLWTGIERAGNRGLGFDFEGSMVESIEHFVRAFGAVQVPYHSIHKVPLKIVRGYRSLRSALKRR